MSQSDDDDGGGEEEEEGEGEGEGGVRQVDICGIGGEIVEKIAEELQKKAITQTTSANASDRSIENDGLAKEDSSSPVPPSESVQTKLKSNPNVSASSAHKDGNEAETTKKKKKTKAKTKTKSKVKTKTKTKSVNEAESPAIEIEKEETSAVLITATHEKQDTSNDQNTSTFEDAKPSDDMRELERERMFDMFAVIGVNERNVLCHTTGGSVEDEKEKSNPCQKKSCEGQYPPELLTSWSPSNHNELHNYGAAAAEMPGFPRFACPFDVEVWIENTAEEEQTTVSKTMREDETFLFMLRVPGTSVSVWVSP